MKQLLLTGLLAVGVASVAWAQMVEPKLVGTWTNCHTELGTSVVSANVCRLIIFRADGTGQACLGEASPSGQDSLGAFTWQRTATEVLLHYRNTSVPVLAAGRYTVSQRSNRILVLTSRQGERYLLTH